MLFFSFLKLLLPPYQKECEGEKKNQLDPRFLIETRLFWWENHVGVEVKRAVEHGKLIK